jgi:hypothetical protein
VKKVVFLQQINGFSAIPSKKACNEMIFIKFEIYRKILSHFHAQGLVVAKLIRSLKPRLCTVLAALSICKFCMKDLGLELTRN